MTAVLPGATLGVLGSGQLGRMFALAARRLGYRVHVYSPESDTPAGQVADLEVCGAYDDLDAVRAFASGVRVVTFEFENVSAASAAAAAERTPVRPAGHVLHTTQQRLREKAFLASAGLPVAPFAALRSAGDVASAVARVGLPAVIKSAAFGYDGKGQERADTTEQAAQAWSRLGPGECVLEAFVDFERELSVLAARGLDGEFRAFPLAENAHVRHVLDVTVAPALVPPRVASEAVALSRAVMQALDVVGVLCVELFLTRDGRLLINELAPRPHNSGHFTIEACATSQFEQQVRAVCGLPLGSSDAWRPAAMANLMGDLWSSGEPAWPAALAVTGVSLHLYGKAEARAGRKMGHLTALGASVDEARARVLDARGALTARG